MSANQVLEPLINNDQRVADLNLDSKTRIIYFLKSIQNRKIKFSTKVRLPKTDDPRELLLAIKRAQRFANAELTMRLGKKKNRVMPLIREELEPWVQIKESEGLAYDTMNNIRRAKKYIEEFWGDRLPSEIADAATRAAWLVDFKRRHPGIRIENTLKYFRVFCRHLASKSVDGLPLLAVAPNIKDPEYKEIKALRKKKKENILTHDDMIAIVNTAESKWHKLIVLIMYTLATRITETLTMRFDEEILLDLESPRYRWTIGQNKADLTGEHALHPILIPMLKELREIRAADGTKHLFPQKFNLQKPIREQSIDWAAWRARANIGWHWTPHTFRHTCLSNLFNDPKNPQALICKLYRCSLAVALDTYVKPTPEGIEGMKDAIKVRL